MYDVAIIGAGPSGCVAARELIQAGAKVVLVDAQQFPRPKTCGGGVLTRALQVLPSEATTAVQRHCSALEVHFYKPKSTFNSRRTDAIASIVTRDELDDALLEGLLKRGADTRLGRALRGFTQGPNGVDLDLDGDGETLQARMLIAADGAQSHCARQAGFADVPRSLLGIQLVLSHPGLELARHARAIRFDFDIISNGYGCVLPLRDALSVGIIAGQTDESKLRAALVEYGKLLDLPPLPIDSARCGSIPVEPRPGGLARERVLLVGDAAGLADPLTGEGLYFGAISARLAAKALHEASFEPAAAREAYQRELEAFVLPELRLGRSVAKLFYGYPRFRNMLFRFAGQALCDVIAEVATGEHSYGDYLGHGAASLSVPQLFKKLVTTYEEETRRS